MATQGSRELRRELTNEVLEKLMERAVAAVQEMDEAEYQAKVWVVCIPCGLGVGAEGTPPGRPLAARAHTHAPCPRFLGLMWPAWELLNGREGRGQGWSFLGRQWPFSKMPCHQIHHVSVRAALQRFWHQAGGKQTKTCAQNKPRTRS